MTLPEMICRLPSQMLIVMTDWWSLLLPTTAASSLAWRHSCVNSRQRTSRNVPSATSRTEPGLPCTAKQMQAIMGELKNITNAEPVVTIKSAMKKRMLLSWKLWLML